MVFLCKKLQGQKTQIGYTLSITCLLRTHANYLAYSILSTN